VALCRDLFLSHIPVWPTVGHLAVLLAFSAGGVLVARRTLTRRLVV
jgi:hypothetical protein